MKWHKAETEAHLWLYYADGFYVTARYLYWKGLINEFAFLGAHTIELYLKAYLIKKTGCYPEGHDLIQIYSECRKHDNFFNEKPLSDYFIPREHNVIIATDWPRYLDATKYPELKRTQRNRGKKWRPYGIGLGTSHNSLDQIAHFVRQNVGIPPGAVDRIKALLNYKQYPGELINEVGTFEEIRQAFLRENDYFGK